jgi:hypothetical protein
VLDSSDVSDPNFDGRLQDIMEVSGCWYLLQYLYCLQALWHCWQHLAWCVGSSRMRRTSWR